ncbi:uncharacterized protein TRIVIDRAFT_62670 [Trichoderma virens Gv29-8]|uniref:Uncharacterized protein n=1 Tax=Hypocrea virens (strain Gv29-8 / FGSC 10586) TaxID=413071 RepID=G9MEQ0_HYPVG|nr:uncharacterized protein TRIVIDRAFT_62670 [Trichoderma virens Gv29-8]EHK26868.1 hypothetical protein TRIVIDRAFT_62670 [Trichoderma virens Gv29-8]UKZ57322.1 hypothetical protein TrVGV298_011175 [Trichoderma virens]
MVNTHYGYSRTNSNMVMDGILWQPGVWRRIPWRTVGSFTGFMVTCGMMALVLALSEDQETNQWPTHNKYFTVPVLLSLMGAIAVLFLSVANSEGFAISWWLKALKGTKIKELHYDLEVTGNLLVGVFRPTLFNVITISSLVSLIVSIAVGAVLQKASDTTSKTIGPYPDHIDIPVLNTTLPSNFSGWAGSGTETSLLMPTFAYVFKQYSNHSIITMPSSCVNKTCQVHIAAPGFDVDCRDSTVSYDTGNMASARGDKLTTFRTSVDWEPSQDPAALNHMNLSILYKPTSACAGKMQQHNCTLRAAAVDYTVTITNGSVTLQPWDISQNTTISITNFTSWLELGSGSVGAGGFLTMFGGLASVLQAQYNSNTTLKLGTMTNTPFIVTAFGQAASTFLTSEIEDYGNCTMSWSDPREDMINNIRELMFRSALAVANSTGAPPVKFKQAEALVTRIGIVYRAHWNFFGIAIGCMFFQLLIILYLIWGWQKLGREVSLDPFEIAKAMGAPLLNHGSSNSSADQILDLLGSRKVKYGELVDGEPKVSGGTAVPKNGYTLVDSNDPDIAMGNLQARNTELSLTTRKTLGLDVVDKVQDVRLGVHY